MKINININNIAKVKGRPIIRAGQVRNQCWNCQNFTNEKYILPKEKGQKQYYCCNHCGSINHK